MKENTHIGVYGIVEQDGKILVIHKTRGPYKGCYDLPGGGIEFRESIEDALRREFMEEVGAEIASMRPYTNTSKTSIWNNNADDVETHHLGMYYFVTLKDPTIIKETPDGHDSAGCEWVAKDVLKQSKLASIIQDLIQAL